MFRRHKTQGRSVRLGGSAELMLESDCQDLFHRQYRGNGHTGREIDEFGYQGTLYPSASHQYHMKVGRTEGIITVFLRVKVLTLVLYSSHGLPHSSSPSIENQTSMTREWLTLSGVLILSISFGFIS